MKIKLEKMLKSVGIDIVEHARISRIMNKFEERFISKVLHKIEIDEYKKMGEKSKLAFLSSRWAVKEALVKTISNKQIVFSKVSLVKSIEGKPNLIIDNHNFDNDIASNLFKFELDIQKRNHLIKDLELKYSHINSIINDNKNCFLCSLSHEENYSVAIVMHTYNL